MAISEKKKISNARWDKENMATLGCRVKKEQAAAFKEYAKALFCQHEKTSWYLEDENILSAKEMVEYTSTEELTP